MLLPRHRLCCNAALTSHSRLLPEVYSRDWEHLRLCFRDGGLYDSVSFVIVIVIENRSSEIENRKSEIGNRSLTLEDNALTRSRCSSSYCLDKSCLMSKRMGARLVLITKWIRLYIAASSASDLSWGSIIYLFSTPHLVAVPNFSISSLSPYIQLDAYPSH